MRPSIWQQLPFAALLTIGLLSCTQPSTNEKVDDPASIRAKATEDLINALSIGEPPQKMFDFEAFKSALARGADVNGKSKAQLTAIYIATVSHAYLADNHPDKANLLEAMRMLLEKGADINVTSYGGSTPLMHAVHRAHSGATDHPVPDIRPAYKVLLAATQPKPDLEVKNEWGETALFYLIGYGELEVAKWLVEAGASFRIVTNSGMNLLQRSISGQRSDVFEYIMSLFPESEREQWANKSEESGRTSLMYAATAGNLDIVLPLLDKYHAKPNLTDVEDETAYSLAQQTLTRAQARGDTARADRLGKIIAALVAHGATTTSQDPDVTSCDKPNGYPMSFERLKRIVTSCGVKDMEDLVPLLPSAYKSNYIPMFGSQSKQGQFADHAHPRLILIGKTGQTMLALTGNKEKPGYNSLEIIEFKDDVKQFELHEIDLTKQVPRFSEKNPPECLGCHRAPTPRPNWYNWTFWPGAYFGEQASQYEQEKKFYAEFQKQIAQEKDSQKGIYRFLLPYGHGDFDTNNGLLYNPASKNLKQDQLTDHYVTEMAMGVMKNEPKLQPFKYALLAAMSCREPIEDFIPEKVRNDLRSQYQDLLAENKALNREEFLTRVDILKRFVPGSPSGQYIIDQLDTASYGGGRSFETIRMAKLRYIIEGLGLPLEWSAIPGAKNYYVFARLSGIEINLWKKLLQDAGDEKDVYRIYSEQYKKLDFSTINTSFFNDGDLSEEKSLPDSSALCSRLKEMSLNSLGTL